MTGPRSLEALLRRSNVSALVSIVTTLLVVVGERVVVPPGVGGVVNPDRRLQSDLKSCKLFFVADVRVFHAGQNRFRGGLPAVWPGVLAGFCEQVVSRLLSPALKLA